MRMNRRDIFCENGNPFVAGATFPLTGEFPCGCPAAAAGFHLNTATLDGVEGVARETARVSPTIKRDFICAE